MMLYQLVFYHFQKNCHRISTFQGTVRRYHAKTTQIAFFFGKKKILSGDDANASQSHCFLSQSYNSLKER